MFIGCKDILWKAKELGLREKSGGRQSVGETVGAKHREVLKILGAGFSALCVFLSAGCGGKSAANVVTVSVTPSTILILGQSVNLTATVGGATNTNVTWSPCQFVYDVTTNGKTTTKDPQDCPSDGSYGVLSNQQTTGTATYTAPDPAKFQLPDQTKFPNFHIVITATSVQDTKKSGKATIALISGIRGVLTPSTASVPTSETQHFLVTLTNDIQGKGVTWTLTQNVPNTDSSGKFLNYPQLPPCTTCGTITPDANNPNGALYKAPDTIPTAITPAQKNNPNPPANVTIVATPNADNSGFVIGTITITPSGPITYRTISPTIAPQGAALWDLYLDAPNISSASKINLTYGNSTQPVVKDSTSGQIKILFPVPAASTSTTTTTTTTCTDTQPCSTGARLRLNAADLATAGPVAVSVTDPNPNVTITQCTGSPLPAGCSSAGVFTFNIIPVRPTSTATVPDDVVLGSQSLGLGFPVIIDGGYFGPFDPTGATQNNQVRVFFQAPGNLLSIDQTHSSSRKLVTSISPNNINPSNPGLYPLYVAQATSQPPATPNNPSVTNMALFPDYSSTQGAISKSPTPIIPAGTNTSAVDIDPDLGVLVVAETGSNTIEFFKIGSTAPYLTSLGTVASTGSAPINVPTGLSVNRANHTVAVVNYGTQTTSAANNACAITAVTGQSVTVLNIPGSPSSITPFSVDLTSTMQGSLCPAPMPYAIGVDPDSNFALVAYSTGSVNPVSSAANLGYIVNLNPNVSGATPSQTSPCALGQALVPSSNQFGECLFAQVTLNNGTYPQVAMAPHGHTALVTPGGSGAVRGVDITKPSTANFIKSADLSAGVVTVIVDTAQCPPGVPATGSSTNPCPLTMIPGNAGSVLITGLTPKTAANSAFFNGVFAVNVTSNNSFTYVIPNASVTDSCQLPNPQATDCGGEVFYGQPDQIFGLPATTQGVAINPITSTAAIADANATGTNGPQIDLLSGLDQSVSSIFFFAGCTAFNSSTCSSAPELLATTNVAWQPFTNEVVSYNPKLGLASLSDPVGRSRYAITTGLGPSAIPFCVSNGTQNPTLTLWGGIAVDPATNLAFVVESGQAAPPPAAACTVANPGQIEVINLSSGTAIKPTHISSVIVPSPASSQGTIGGIPNALVPQAALACTTPTPPATTCDLPGVKIFGAGFAAGMQVRLDNVDITTLTGGAVGPPLNGGREVDVTIPASALARPHHYALDVLSSGAQSNAVDFLVVQAVDLSQVCTSSGGGTVNTMPSSVAIADQIASGPFSPLGLVSVTGCNSIVEIDLNPANATFGQIIGSPISVGTNPQGIAIWQRQGLAVVANNGNGTASVIDLTKSPPASPLTADVTTGTNPTGVAINEATGAALVTNFASNTVSLINLGLLFPQPNASSQTPPTTLTASTISGIQMPIAVAIDPDRGTNNQGIAVVTAVSLNSTLGPTGSLAVVEIGQATPALSTTFSPGFVSSTPTGIVFDPTVVSNTTTNQGAFFANSSGTNSITEFIPEGGGGSVSVGINPTSLAINPQTGAIFTSNSASNTVSVVDTISSPFKTHQTLGIPGSPTFGVAIDQFTNLAVIVDQANMRVLLFPMPN